MKGGWYSQDVSYLQYGGKKIEYCVTGSSEMESFLEKSGNDNINWPPSYSIWCAFSSKLTNSLQTGNDSL